MMDAASSRALPEAGAAGGARCGIVAVVGRANVGKSSLVNRILGEKVAIVSGVAQTTRNLIRGVLSDSPGIHRARGNLGKLLNKKARGALDGADVILLVLDRSISPKPEDDGWMRRALHADVPVRIVLNKCDLAENHADAYRRRWQALRAAREQPPDTAAAGARPEPEWMSISAAEGIGVDTLVGRLFAAVPVGPPLFGEDLLSDYPRKLAMADCIREKLFLHLRDELPHQVAVRVESIDESGETWVVRALVYVNKPSQKPIVLGRKGRTLRAVRRAAAAEIADMYDCKVTLELWVKVEKNWIDNFFLLRQMDVA